MYYLIYAQEWEDCGGLRNVHDMSRNLVELKDKVQTHDELWYINPEDMIPVLLAEWGTLSSPKYSGLLSADTNIPFSWSV